MHQHSNKAIICFVRRLNIDDLNKNNEKLNEEI